MFKVAMWLVVLFSLSACQQRTLPANIDDLVTALKSISGQTSCSSLGIFVEYGFDNALVNDCEITANKVSLTITPENTPINDSAWYAFKISSARVQNTEIEINYQAGSHRYAPKVSDNLKSWRELEYTSTKAQLTFTVETSQQARYIAGQEIVDNHAYQQWIEQYRHREDIVVASLGKSIQGREIIALEIANANNNANEKEWLIVLGRMHPPEVTGALALFPFVDVLLSEQGQAFRERFNILVVPNLNPDGVANGHWRHNADGVDLNRDWKSFKQVETRLVRNKLNQITNRGDKIAFAVDFHSTHRDVFYTLPSDYGIKPPLLVEQWLAQLAQEVPQFTVNNKPGTSNIGVFKQFIADTYKVHAITYEMGDNTNRQVIEDVAKAASKTLMDNLLKIQK
ncbi:MAG: M14-type cytosolic carboxypeptidase [Psychrobium sp.]